jgi:hypothetical protein
MKYSDMSVTRMKTSDTSVLIRLVYNIFKFDRLVWFENIYISSRDDTSLK